MPDSFLLEIEGKRKFPFPSKEIVTKVSVSPKFQTQITWGNFTTFYDAETEELRRNPLSFHSNFFWKIFDNGKHLCEESKTSPHLMSTAKRRENEKET